MFLPNKKDILVKSKIILHQPKVILDKPKIIPGRRKSTSGNRKSILGQGAPIAEGVEEAEEVATHMSTTRVRILVAAPFHRG
jgi:hypothetical protein